MAFIEDPKQRNQKPSGSFLKKRTKKLLLLWAMGVMPPTPQA
jgi:hypothetical protein